MVQEESQQSSKGSRDDVPSTYVVLDSHSLNLNIARRMVITSSCAQAYMFQTKREPETEPTVPATGRRIGLRNSMISERQIVTYMHANRVPACYYDVEYRLRIEGEQCGG